MKTKPLIALCVVLALIVCSNSIPSVLASNRLSVVSPQSPSEVQLAYPISRRCVVTVDPFSSSTPVVAGSANIVTGFVAPNTIEGSVVAMDDEWLVIRSGRHENWIPRSKVLMIHLSE